MKQSRKFGPGHGMTLDECEIFIRQDDNSIQTKNSTLIRMLPVSMSSKIQIHLAS